MRIRKSKSLRRLATALWPIPGVIAVLAGGGADAFANGQAAEHAAHHQAAEPVITFATEPTTPVAGENTFTVTVKDKDGKPVTGAAVSAEFMMPAMPGMRKPLVVLSPPADPKIAAEGVYTGKGRLSMSGKWSVTITVTVDDKVFAEKTLAIEAK